MMVAVSGRGLQGGTCRRALLKYSIKGLGGKAGEGCFSPFCCFQAANDRTVNSLSSIKGAITAAATVTTAIVSPRALNTSGDRLGIINYDLFQRGSLVNRE
jgi:hypothetical protein